jgi:hypothetical protein
MTAAMNGLAGMGVREKSPKKRDGERTPYITQFSGENTPMHGGSVFPHHGP